MRKIPSVVQLPGGIKLEAIPFRVVERTEDGVPTLFEIMPRGTEVKDADMFALFGIDAVVRKARK